jgi:hypothetical protein
MAIQRGAVSRTLFSQLFGALVILGAHDHFTFELYVFTAFTVDCPRSRGFDDDYK